MLKETIPEGLALNTQYLVLANYCNQKLVQERPELNYCKLGVVPFPRNRLHRSLSENLGIFIVLFPTELTGFITLLKKPLDDINKPGNDPRLPTRSLSKYPLDLKRTSTNIVVHPT